MSQLNNPVVRKVLYINLMEVYLLALVIFYISISRVLNTEVYELQGAKELHAETD